MASCVPRPRPLCSNTENGPRYCCCAILQEARESAPSRGSIARPKKNSPDNGQQAPGCLWRELENLLSFAAIPFALPLFAYDPGTKVILVISLLYACHSDQVRAFDGFFYMFDMLTSPTYRYLGPAHANFEAPTDTQVQEEYLCLLL